MSHPIPTHEYGDDNGREPDIDAVEESSGALPDGAGFADRCMNVVAGGDPDLFWALTGKLKHHAGRAPRIFAGEPETDV